jgi:hypothetical protein
MTTYTLADASQPSIVRKALDDALVSGHPMPNVLFGPIARGKSISAHLDQGGTWVVGTWYTGWTVPPMRELTTDQAVAAITAAVRNERK